MAAALRELFTLLRESIELDPVTTQFPQLNCDDLQIQEPEKELSSKLTELSEEWRQLDETYLWKDKKKKQKPTYIFGSKFLTLPSNLDILNLTDEHMEGLRHNDIPEETRLEYLRKVFDLFKRMPLVTQVEERFYSVNFELDKLKQANEGNPFSETYRKLFVPDINYLPVESESFQPTRNNVSACTIIS